MAYNSSNGKQNRCQTGCEREQAFLCTDCLCEVFLTQKVCLDCSFAHCNKVVSVYDFSLCKYNDDGSVHSSGKALWV